MPCSAAAHRSASSHDPNVARSAVTGELHITALTIDLIAHGGLVAPQYLRRARRAAAVAAVESTMSVDNTAPKRCPATGPES